MDDFAGLPPEERRIFIEQAAMRTGLPQTVLEKDYWVCWLLKQLFSTPKISDYLIFKGGTSLSKSYGLIQRFSEDVDISIDRSLIGFSEDIAALALQSNTATRKKLDALQAAGIKTVKDVIAPAVREAVGGELSEVWNIEEDISDPLTLLFHFPSALERTAFSYITPYVKMEFGARADLWPQELKPVRSYLAAAFPEQIDEGAGFEIRTLSAERTFWEKVTILHAEYHRPQTKAFPARLSRHHYDLLMLFRSDLGKNAARNLALLARVVQHKQVFFKSSWANYESSKPGTLKLVPPPHQISALRSDYALMRDMFFSTPPSFEEILNNLAELEKLINGT